MARHGRIKVYDHQFMRDMMPASPSMSESEEQSSFPRTRSVQSSKQRSILLTKEKTQKRHEQFLSEQAAIRANGQRKIRENLHEKARRKEESFNRNFRQLNEGHRLAGEMGTMLMLQEEQKKRKAREEYKEWDRNVYKPTAAAVLESVNALNYKQLNQRKQDEYQQFLDTTNRKGQIFRDIIIESEYDSLESNRKDIRVKMTKMNDPINRCLDKKGHEDSLAAPSHKDLMRTTSKISRGGVPVPQWGTGKIEATPHGYFSKMISEEPGTNLNITKSSVFMDHYQMPGKEANDAEFPLGKRVDIPSAENW